MSSLIHKYIPRTDQREENLFLEEYYSGTDTKIFIDGTEQKEVSYIQYSVNEQLKPIYGYNSRTFDDVAIGNRIVMGTIKVPIKNPSAQSTYEEVVGAYNPSTQDKIEDFNLSESNTKDSVEWISKNESYEELNTNVEFEYQNKLEALGYTVTNKLQLQSAIRSFQETAGIEITGTLTTNTKNAINEALALSNLEAKILKYDVVLYSGPAESFREITTLPVNTTVYIINDELDNYVMINTLSGKTGFIKREYIE